MHNVTGALSSSCLQNYDCMDEWRCFFAPVLEYLLARGINVHLLCFIRAVLIPLHQDPHIHWKLTV